MDLSLNLNIRNAAQIMQQGGVVAYPTEAVWGLGCDPANEAAVQRLLELKQRPVEKGLILLAGDESMVAPYLAALSDVQRQTLSDSWPGPNTWIIPEMSERVPTWVRGRFSSVAIRVTAHPWAAALSRAFGGPIVSTSANPTGSAAALDESEVQRYFQARVDHICVGAVGGSSQPSIIRDLQTGAVIRGA
jgi:L-threonylcarbamoyladenylate synthase